jgi:hypothetical protein
VTYRYLAGDVQRTGVTIKFGVNSYGDRQTAEDILARYPVGRPALVYYDPEEPERSVQEPGVTAGSYIVLGIGVLFTALAIIVAPLIFLFGGRD